MSEKWEALVEQALQDLREETTQKELSKIEDEVFDKPTMKALSQLISHGYLDTLDYCVSTGKEANVFRGTTPEGAYVAVKVYRVHTSSFRSHAEYLWGDPRFDTGTPNKREMISIWATKEFKNLTRYTDAECRVPVPITVRDNVLVMEFIGDDGIGAPMLKQVDLDNPQVAFDELIAFVRRGWRDGRLVHGDLSEYNVLLHDGDLVVIDTAQAVVADHPRSRELLERDLTNLCKSFKRLKVEADPQALLEDILAETADDEEDAAAEDDEEHDPDDPATPDPAGGEA